jgi:hypothetical protein
MPRFWKKYVFDPEFSLPAIVVLIIAEICVNIIVIHKIKCKKLVTF